MIIMTPAKRLSPTTHPTERSRRAGGDDEKLLSGYACERAAISVPPRRCGFLRRVLCPGENRRAGRARFPHPPEVSRGRSVAPAIRTAHGRQLPRVTDLTDILHQIAVVCVLPRPAHRRAPCPGSV